MIRPITPLDMTSVPNDQVDNQSGFGALETKRGCLPLVEMSVRASITGLDYCTTVAQTFRNALDEPLEATYIFPLPDRAAVTSFQMRVADRVIDGELKERGQARADYQQAIRDGHRAAIAEEDRSGTFNLRVGNIPPAEDVEVVLTLVGPLPVCAGEATFRFPLVIAPRYVPGAAIDGPSVGAGWASDTDQVPDASRVTPPVLLPGFPNPVRLSLEVDVDPAGLTTPAADRLSQFRSSLHSIATSDGPPWTIRLQPGERLNRDFILRFPIGAGSIQPSLVCSSSESEPGTFALTLVPPAASVGELPRPRDIVFVLDRSGSMQGWKMVAARRAMARMIDTLLDQDRFTVLAFDNTIEFPAESGGRLIAATDRARWRTLEWLGTIEARGGTEIVPALVQATRLLAADARDRQSILVFVTDGQVAGEDIALKSVSEESGGFLPRIYTLGIDRAVNAGFLRRLADLGGGNCDLVESEERLDEAMGHVHRAIGTPTLTNIRVEPVAGEWLSDTTAPSRLPDLFPDRPVTIYARHKSAAGVLRVRVRAIDASGKPWQQELAAQPGPADTLASLWGRARIRDLEDRYAAGDVHDAKALANDIVAVSLKSHVLSRFTAYVAVDRSEVVNESGTQLQVVQPVELPDGWASPALACSLGPTPELGSPVMLDCCISPGDDLRAFGKSASLGTLGGFLLGSILRDRRPRKAAPAAGEHKNAGIAAVVNDALRLLNELSEGRKRRHAWRRRHLERLRELLVQIAGLLQQQQNGHPTAGEIEQACRDIETLLTRERGTGDAAEHMDQLRALQRVLQAILSGPDVPPDQSPERTKFWL